jgi:hypothetical protein
MSHLLPTTGQLLAAPELAILHALEAGLAAAHRALLTAYPELQEEDLCDDRPLHLNGSGWIADAIITQISGLSTSIARYRREFERARQARLHDPPF